MVSRPLDLSCSNEIEAEPSPPSFPPPLRSPEEDSARLEDTLSVISEDNLIATSLLLISWDSSEHQESIEDAVSSLRPLVLPRRVLTLLSLQLDVENLPIPYDRICIVHLNVSDTDAAFASAVKNLVRKIGSINVRMVSPEGQSRLALLFDLSSSLLTLDLSTEYMKPLEPVWMDLLAFGVDVLALEPVGESRLFTLPSRRFLTLPLFDVTQTGTSLFRRSTTSWTRLTSSRLEFCKAFDRLRSRNSISLPSLPPKRSPTTGSSRLITPLLPLALTWPSSKSTGLPLELSKSTSNS